MKIINFGILFFTISFTFQIHSQNNNVVSAALEYKKYQGSFVTQDLEGAKEHLLTAKPFIDLAMQHASTENDPKANYYNAIINYGLLELSAVVDDEKLKVYQNDSIKDVLEVSIKKSYGNKRWKREMEDFFTQKVNQSIMIGEMMFKQKKFDMAFAGFAGAYQIKKIADIEEEQEAMKTNAIISAMQYIDTLKKTGDKEKAMEFVNATIEMFPESEELAIEGVNLALEDNDMETAEKFFGMAAKANPKNKVLFSNMGSIYLTQADKLYSEFEKMDITDDGYQEQSDKVEELYGKAESNLKRAIEIDPDYAEASYNLGVLYLGRGEKFKTLAGQMDFNNPDYDKVSEKSQEMYQKAIAPLENYIKQDPNNAGVLNVLFQVYRSLGNSEKALEYKKRADEAK